MTARAKILKLPEVGQRLVGTGEIPLSAIDNLLAITTVSPAITQALVDAVAADKFAGAQIAGNPGWAIGRHCVTPALPYRGRGYTNGPSR